jgi:tRNA threonylcarbamoyladenosine biosynthesis protein TsaE
VTPASAQRTVHLASLAATQQFGQWLGQRLFAGAVVGLCGPLGAGKTQLVRAIAQGLAIRNERVVNSPTFVLLQEYHDARLPIYHFDLYRLTDERQLAELGADEYFYGPGVCLIEWADRFLTALPDERLLVWLRLGPQVSESRTLDLQASGSRYVQLLGERSFPFDAAPPAGQ